MYQRQGWSGVLRLLPALLQDVVVGALGERLERGKMMWHRFFARTVGSVRHGGRGRPRLVVGMLAALCILLALAAVPLVREHQAPSAEREAIRPVVTQCFQTTDHPALIYLNGSGYVAQPVPEMCYMKLVLNGSLVVMLTPTFVLAGTPEPAYPTWPRCGEMVRLMAGALSSEPPCTRTAVGA